MAAYFGELDERFDDGFDAGDTLVRDAANFEPPFGAFVVARSGADTAGCGAVQVLPDGAAEVKRMWIAKPHRGRGLGKTLLAHLEDHAKALGNGTVRLDTNSALTEAIAMYKAAGYHEIDSYNDNPFARHWFEKQL